MSIVASDIVVKGSTTSGSAGNTTANGGAGTNLGKYATTGALTDNTLNNLFPDTTGAENAASQVDYQCIFLHNNHASITWQSVVAWLSAETAGGDSIAIGVDTTAASAVGGAGAQALTIANKNTAPAGVSFSAPTTQGAGVSVGDIPAGQVKAIWVRRTAANSAALANDSVSLSYAGDTV